MPLCTTARPPTHLVFCVAIGHAADVHTPRHVLAVPARLLLPRALVIAV